MGKGRNRGKTEKRRGGGERRQERSEERKERGKREERAKEVTRVKEEGKREEIERKRGEKREMGERRYSVAVEIWMFLTYNNQRYKCRDESLKLLRLPIKRT